MVTAVLRPEVLRAPGLRGGVGRAPGLPGHWSGLGGLAKKVSLHVSRHTTVPDAETPSIPWGL